MVLTGVLVGAFVLLAIVYAIMLLGDRSERLNAQDQNRAEPDDGSRGQETRAWGGLGRPGSGF